MTWVYGQDSGVISNGDRSFTGYSGAYPDGVNNPDLESKADVGPIPAGLYAIGAPVNMIEHGPFVLRLTPHPENEMYGRVGFLIHGDSIEHPGQASHGCIILPRDAREAIWASGDDCLRVIRG